MGKAEMKEKEVEVGEGACFTKILITN